MNIDKILSNLEKIGFGKKEAEVFLELLKNPKSNGSQIAKVLGYPRTTVYQNLDLLEKKGYIKSYLDKEITYYEVINLDDFFDEQKKRVEDSTKILKDEFKKLNISETQKQFYNINFLENIEKRISQMLLKAEKEIFINTNIDLQKFKKELYELKKKKIKVILFSFHQLENENINELQNSFKELGIEAYIRDDFNKEKILKNKRIMMVVDDKAAIIAGNYEGEFSGTYSENKLLVTIVREHIINDINLTNLEVKYGKDILKENALIL